MKRNLAEVQSEGWEKVKSECKGEKKGVSDER